MTGWKQGEIPVTHDAGLHARPSVRLTKLAKGFAGAIEISGTAQGPWVDAKSIVKVMGLKVRQGAMLHVRAKGDDAEAALAAVTGLVQRDFDEDLAHAASG
jgi:phosphocarrier protein